MRQLSIIVLVGLAACGEPYERFPPWPVDAVPSIDASRPTGACNVLTQTGECNVGDKCTWIRVQDNPLIAYIGCAPNPTTSKAIGEACTSNPAGPMGWDDCVLGSVCLAGVCKQICDANGGAPTCDENHSCMRYADLFEVGGNVVAGVCDPGCDPLTQELKVGTTKDACGSSSPTVPDHGCYGYDEYSCAWVTSSVLTLLDRDPPRTNEAGNPYLNGCAPGFIPFFFEETGSTTTLCSGFCSVLEIDDTQPGNNQGNPEALAKMPTDPEPVAGHGICSALYKGSSASSSCRFLWPYVEDDQGDLPLVFAQGPYLDTLGVCFEYTQFTYDHDMNPQTANVPYPDCGALPKRSASTTGQYDDAADWGCQKRASSQFADDKPQLNAALKQVRLPKQEPMELVRHRFD